MNLKMMLDTFFFPSDVCSWLVDLIKNEMLENRLMLMKVLKDGFLSFWETKKLVLEWGSWIKEVGISLGIEGSEFWSVGVEIKLLSIGVNYIWAIVLKVSCAVSWKMGVVESEGQKSLREYLRKHENGRSPVSKEHETWFKRVIYVSLSVSCLYGYDVERYEVSKKKMELSFAVMDSELAMRGEEQYAQSLKKHNNENCACCHCKVWEESWKERKKLLEELHKVAKKQANMELAANKPNVWNAFGIITTILSVWFMVDQRASVQKSESK